MNPLRFARVIPEAVALTALVAPGLAPGVRANAPVVAICALLAIETVVAVVRPSRGPARVFAAAGIAAARALICVLPLAAQVGTGQTPWVETAAVVFAVSAAAYAAGAWAQSPLRAAAVFAGWSAVWVMPFAAALAWPAHPGAVEASASASPAWCPYFAISGTALSLDPAVRPWLYVNTPFSRQRMTPAAGVDAVGVRYVIVTLLFLAASRRRA